MDYHSSRNNDGDKEQSSPVRDPTSCFEKVGSPCGGYWGTGIGDDESINQCAERYKSGLVAFNIGGAVYRHDETAIDVRNDAIHGKGGRNFGSISGHGRCSY